MRRPWSIRLNESIGDRGSQKLENEEWRMEFWRIRGKRMGWSLGRNRGRKNMTCDPALESKPMWGKRVGTYLTIFTEVFTVGTRGRSTWIQLLQ